MLECRGCCHCRTVGVILPAVLIIGVASLLLVLGKVEEETASERKGKQYFSANALVSSSAF